MKMVGGNRGNQFRQYTRQIVGNQANENRNGNIVAAQAEVRPRRRDVTYLLTHLLIAQKEEARIQLQAEEFDLMADASDLNEIEEMVQLRYECEYSVCKQSILEKPSSSSKPKLYAVTPFPKYKDLPKIDEARVDNTAKTRRRQSRSNTKNDRVPFASKSSSIKNKEVEVEEHPKNLLLSKNKKHMSSESKNVKLDIQSNKSEVVCAMCFGDLQWGNILITRVYFVEGLGHNLFSVGQFSDSNLEVAFRRNTYFVINLEGVDLLKGNCTTNLYTINLYEMDSASPICLMAHATSTKSWLWHQHLSHLNIDNINDLAKNNLVTGLPKFKYHKEHLCPSCE
nr:retrovirus-related Pol polyprotein from transposon TNT 1-94 [Tanacetum cinerariifolium]